MTALLRLLDKPKRRLILQQGRFGRSQPNLPKLTFMRVVARNAIYERFRLGGNVAADGFINDLKDAGRGCGQGGAERGQRFCGFVPWAAQNLAGDKSTVLPERSISIRLAGITYEALS